MAAANDDKMVIDLSKYECYVIKHSYLGNKTYIGNVIKIKDSSDISANDSICIILDKDSQVLQLSLSNICDEDVLKYNERVLNSYDQNRWWYRVYTRFADLTNNKKPTNEWILLNDMLDKNHPFRTGVVLEIYRRGGWS